MFRFICSPLLEARFYALNRHTARTSFSKNDPLFFRYFISGPAFSAPSAVFNRLWSPATVIVIIISRICVSPMASTRTNQPCDSIEMLSVERADGPSVFAASRLLTCV